MLFNEALKNRLCSSVCHTASAAATALSNPASGVHDCPDLNLPELDLVELESALQY